MSGLSLRLATFLVGLSIAVPSDPARPVGPGAGDRPPPASDAEGGRDSALTPGEAADLVAFHNKAREKVGVPPVTWSPEVARYAQAWADELAKTGKFEHRPLEGEWARKYGENLAIGSTAEFDALSGAKIWGDEIEAYPPGTPIPADFSGFKAGHYTQMVWRGTAKIGAGLAVIQAGPRKGWRVLVCNYDPPGNIAEKAPY